MGFYIVLWGKSIITGRKLYKMSNIIKNKDTEDKEPKIQYILDENGELTEMLKKDAKPVDFPIQYKLKNAFEVFVRVKGTENYWISNYGRCVNNHHSGNTFYKHKEGNCHYTVYDIEYVPVKKRGKLTGKTERNKYKRDTTPAELVAETFLVGYKGRTKVWHKDGDVSNNWYKNLLAVTPDDYKALRAGRVTWKELDLGQEYIEYENKASYHAYKEYNAIRARCGDTKDNDSIGRCYDRSSMWQVWLDDPKSFLKWYLGHYYVVDGESMAVDKDLFGDGSGMYHPDFCCILPQGLNTLLTNCKKHYKEGENKDNTLPLGVRYNSKTKKYHAEIQFTGTDRPVTLSVWDTPEEAFAEYKKMKQADICIVAAKYKESIPQYIYEALLKVEVRPY